MVQSLVSTSHELYEVINAFPVLKQVLGRFDISSSDVHEGESVDDFCRRKHFTQEEERIFVNHLNSSVKRFLRK